MALVENKLNTLSQAASITSMRNISEVRQDAHQEYVQQERTKYDALLSLMIQIVGNIERIWNGITHFTSDPL